LDDVARRPIGYHQTASASSPAASDKHTGADVVMFLDADEFINVPDRASLETALTA